MAVERFVLHWGDLGGRWGVNRSVSQIHALLYVSDRPRTAEEIADLLGLARSNVSTSIKELLAWELIRRKTEMTVGAPKVRDCINTSSVSGQQPRPAFRQAGPP